MILLWILFSQFLRIDEKLTWIECLTICFFFLFVNNIFWLCFVFFLLLSFFELSQKKSIVHFIGCNIIFLHAITSWTWFFAKNGKWSKNQNANEIFKKITFQLPVCFRWQRTSPQLPDYMTIRIKQKKVGKRRKRIDCLWLILFSLLSSQSSCSFFDFLIGN